LKAGKNATQKCRIKLRFSRGIPRGSLPRGGDRKLHIEGFHGQNGVTHSAQVFQ